MPFDPRNQDLHRFDGFTPLVSIRHGFGDRVEIRRIRRQTNFPLPLTILQPCPLYYSPDNVLLLLLHGWGVIKLVWDRFITALLGELSKLSGTA